MSFNRATYRWRFPRLGVGRFGQDRFDHLVLKNRQGGNLLQRRRTGLVIAPPVFVNQILAAQLLQVVRSMTGLVLLRRRRGSRGASAQYRGARADAAAHPWVALVMAEALRSSWSRHAHYIGLMMSLPVLPPGT